MWRRKWMFYFQKNDFTFYFILLGKKSDDIIIFFLLSLKVLINFKHLGKNFFEIIFRKEKCFHSSRIFIDGRKNVGNCEDSPPTGENNSSFSFFIHLVIKTFVRKFFSFGYRHKKRQKSPEFIYIFTRFRTWKLFVFYSPGKKITASQKKLFSHLWKHSFNLISGRKNVFHSWEEKKTPDIFFFFKWF